MNFKVSTSLQYQVQSSSTIILNIHPLNTHHQTVVTESFNLKPSIQSEELTDITTENRFVRFGIHDPGLVDISYQAEVDNHYEIIDCSNVQEVPVCDMPSDVLVYLNPSRYCQSDRLYRLAKNNFDHIENPFKKVIAITEWIHKNVEYLSGSTNSETSAYDTVTQQAGVCRDFAHLGIALCRALTIPARYFTAYAYQLFPPDFHACFEAYIGNNWIMFDATKLIPLNGMIKIATGRDAADTAIASLFGDVSCSSIQIGCELSEGQLFEPFTYTETESLGICYK